MGVFFNAAAALISIQLMYLKYGTDSSHEESCILWMENLERIIDDILLSTQSPLKIHENTKNLYDACIQTVDCFNLKNQPNQNSTIQEWAEFFQRKVKPVCDSLRYQSGEFFMCISRFQVGEFKLNTTSSEFNYCYLGDAEYEELSNFVERKCGFSAVKNMMEHENYVRSTLCKSTKKN